MSEQQKEQATGDQCHEEHVAHDLPDGHPDKPVAQRCVLIAVDNSDLAERAFHFYVNYLHKPENYVQVFNVCEPPNFQSMVGFGGFSGGYAFPVDQWQQEIDQKKEESHRLQQKYVKLMRESSLHGKVTIYWSDNPGHGIDAYVKQCNKSGEHLHVSLIVMGSRGLGKLRRTFMGSSSNYVLHHAHVPLCIVPPVKANHSH